MTYQASRSPAGRLGRRRTVPRGFSTMVCATAVLFAVCSVFAPSSIAAGALSGSLPFAAILAIVGLGQMLVVQQGGFDLSVAGGVSLAVVIATHLPAGHDSALLPAVVAAFACAALAGACNGVMAGDSVFGLENTVWFALLILLFVLFIVKKTVIGRRFELIGANPRAARTMGLKVRRHQAMAYVFAQLLYCVAGILLAGITAQPTAYQGGSLLLPSVAVVVLAGTSLLGGRGYPVSTVIAALFLNQLSQFALAVGVPYSAQTIIQALALGFGIAVYSLRWPGRTTKINKSKDPEERNELVAS
jgi:ribose transport system permease protein